MLAHFVQRIVSLVGSSGRHSRIWVPRTQKCSSSFAGLFFTLQHCNSSSPQNSNKIRKSNDHLHRKTHWMTPFDDLSLCLARHSLAYETQNAKALHTPLRPIAHWTVIQDTAPSVGAGRAKNTCSECLHSQTNNNNNTGNFYSA